MTGRDNIGVYRGQIVDRDKIAKPMVPSQGWGGHFRQYKAIPEPMPAQSRFVSNKDDCLVHKTVARRHKSETAANSAVLSANW